MKQLIEILQNSRHYTISVANAMPADAYTFKPVAEVWSFGELLNHIAYGIYWWQENFIKGNEIPWDPTTMSLEKADIIDGLQNAYDALNVTITSAPAYPETMKGFHATMDHITHHRGQAVVYLRLQRIVPPEYTF